MKLIDLTKNLTESESVRGIRCNGNEEAAQVESTVAVEHLMDVAHCLSLCWGGCIPKASSKARRM